MALTKETVVDQITVTENGTIFYRETTRIMEDGKQLSQTYHRTSLIPGQDTTNQPQKVKDICNVVWTPEAIAAYEAQKAAQQINTPSGA
jgi:hypothetical protein